MPTPGGYVGGSHAPRGVPFLRATRGCSGPERLQLCGAKTAKFAKRDPTYVNFSKWGASASSHALGP